MYRMAILLIVAATSLAAAGCGGSDADRGKSSTDAEASGQQDLPQGSEPVKLDPADFTTRIDNPYWPMAPATNGSTAKRSRGSRSCGSR